MTDSCQIALHKKVCINASNHRDFLSKNIVNANKDEVMPYIKIIEQPAPKALRFRYECEGRSAGSIPGINSTPENKTYPTIQIVGYKGRAVVVVSCVTKDPPYRAHPHNLVGKEGCKKGICTLELNNDSMIASFSNLGIQCVKKKDIEEALRVREDIRVDPFRNILSDMAAKKAIDIPSNLEIWVSSIDLNNLMNKNYIESAGFSHRSQANSIDLNAVRLCFQAFLDGSERGKFDVLTPVVSDPIYDKKAMSDLCICKLSDTNASVIGGKEIILLCEKVGKDDIQVRFYEELDGQVVWDGYGDFSPAQVHKQVAISFRTPRYKTIQVERAIRVSIQLRRPSDGITSESLPFFLTPLDTEPVYMKRKRQKFSNDNELLRHLQEFSDAHADTTQYNQQHAAPYTSSMILGNNKFSANVYNRSRTPSPLDYQSPPMFNNMPPGGISHMSGGTMLCTSQVNNYSPLGPSNNMMPPSLPALSSLKPQSVAGIGSTISGVSNRTNSMCRDAHDLQPHLQGAQVVSSDAVGSSLPAFPYNYNLSGVQNTEDNDKIHLQLKEEIDSNIMDIDNHQCSIELSLSRLDSKDLAELSMLDAGNLSENLSNCLTLSDTKPLCSSSSKSNNESMTDSLTKLTNKTLNDLCTLNQLYEEKS